MRNRIARMAVLGLFLLAPLARADDAADKDKAQYEALAKSRADAELAVRQAHDFFDDAEKEWRQLSQAIEMGRSVADEALMKSINAEQLKPEDQRDQKVIDAGEQDRQELDKRWQNYGVELRPGLEADFHAADNQAAASSQLVHALQDVEPQLKETRSDLAALATLYDEAAASAKASEDSGSGSLENLRKIEQTWEPTTQPAEITPPTGN